MFTFLIHPVQVAPVMWFAQRMTVMAATFYLVSYLLYLDFRASKSFAIWPFGSILVSGTPVQTHGCHAPAAASGNRGLSSG